MTIQIDHPKIDQWTTELTAYTGESVTQAVVNAVRERLDREKKTRSNSLAEDLLRIGRECAALPPIDNRSPDEIIGYNHIGAPT
jgi:antitoxin VapB